MGGGVAYYEQQSEALFGRGIRQVLLLNANQFNARTFDALAQKLESRGYRFVSLASPFFAGEPGVPDWIARASGTER